MGDNHDVPVLSWKRVETVAARGSVAPTARSGHSLSVVGSNAYLFGGCDISSPPGPTNATFLLKMSSNAAWEWEKLKFDPTECPLPRWKHSATIVDNKIYVFGGFFDSTTRYNDVWVFSPITLTWTRTNAVSTSPEYPSATPNGQLSTPQTAQHRVSMSGVNANRGGALSPPPRGGHSAVAIRRCLYVFGGYGGSGYGRKDFDDLHMLRLDDMTWSKVTTKGKVPESRAGHQACAVDDLMIICGGWNSVSQFNDLYLFDTTTSTWTMVEGPHMACERPRWNHAMCAVLAIPNAKIFVFGGVKGVVNDYNNPGTFSNDIVILDSGDLTWSTPVIRGALPEGRSDTTLAYDDRGSRLLVFGGWANLWLQDLYMLDVSCVVGPPYAITGIFPTFGAITGGTALVVEGIDFVNMPSVVRFWCRDGFVDVAGEYVNGQTLQVTTPDFTSFPPGEVQVRVAMQGDSFTTTFQTFTFFSVTDASASFAYGPGVLCGGASGEVTTFVIEARDANGQLRTCGGDVFEVDVFSEDVGAIFIPNLEIQDLNDGRYIVNYTISKPGEYSITVYFQGTFGGKPGQIRGSPFAISFNDMVTRDFNLLSGKLVMDQVIADLQELKDFTYNSNKGLEQSLSGAEWTPEQTTAAVVKLKEHVYNVEKRGDEIRMNMEQLKAEIVYLQEIGVTVTNELETMLSIETTWNEVVRKVPAAVARITPLISNQSLKLRHDIEAYTERLQQVAAELQEKGFWSYAIGVDGAFELLEEERKTLEEEERIYLNKRHVAQIFDNEELTATAGEIVASMEASLRQVTQLWESIDDVTRKLDMARELPWSMVDALILEEEAKGFLQQVKAVHKDIRDCDAFKNFNRFVREFLATCPLLQALRHPSMRRRHWTQVMETTGKTFSYPEDDPDLCFADILALNLHEWQREIEEITDKAQREAKQEATLQDMDVRWSNAVFASESYKESDVHLLHMTEETTEMIESDQLVTQTMVSARNNFFLDLAKSWQIKLRLVADVSAMLGEIQRTWSYLEPLFIGSDEVKKELPEPAAKFIQIDTTVRKILKQMKDEQDIGNMVSACELPGLEKALKGLLSSLEECQHALKEFLEFKRQLFPRFYFVSEADLLDLLSNGNDPKAVMVHLEKVFLATKTLMLEPSTEGMIATQFVSSDSGAEHIPFEQPFALVGKVESYLQSTLEAMRLTLKDHLKRSLVRFPEQNRAEWLLQKMETDESGGSAKGGPQSPMDAAQIALVVAGVEFCRGVESTFNLLAKGQETAMAEYLKKIGIQLSDLIQLTQTSLSRADRQRVMCLITMDAHSRDVVQDLIKEKITSPSSFLWQSQLKQRCDKNAVKAQLEICDATFDYGFEYLGNGPRLVITPLTDRIYVTATQALKMQLGCAPAGPAGTGKTETTKDLANAMGKVCYVFNCSPEMDYKSLGNIFKGLASSGAWGCFDEFNRLAPEVLSVCSVQFKAVCDGIRADSDEVVIEGDRVRLDPTCGAFITMNPGYLGRSELPEGLKVLFRPITVMAPNLVLICENMLMAEGFLEAKLLASKFCTLYSLVKELLSKQEHYDWGLRAVKSVLVVAGALKRAEPKLSEQAILMRSLRDFNVPKIVEQDLPMFTGLLNDLFPGINPPKKIDEAMQKFVQNASEELGLWPHEYFRSKVLQLDEILAVRHCVFVIGPAGCGKTECCETLVAASKKRGESHSIKVTDLNPKAVSTEELYGYMMLGTREWKDGLLSKIMRDTMNAATTDSRPPRWIVLDGDLDANWIESMNSVMDDNKMLTLASNERIPLKPSMRLVFEIRDLHYATPATVSRAGILYMSSDEGVAWRSFVASWVGIKGEDLQQRQNLTNVVKKYVEPCLNFVSSECKTIVPLEAITLVQSYLYFLNSTVENDIMKEAGRLEMLCAFASVWAFGGPLTTTDEGMDYRMLFSEWWRNEFKHIRLPSRETVFDYWLNPLSYNFETWKSSPLFKPVSFDGSVAMTSVTVPTPETTAISHWMALMIRQEKPFMLCGHAGTGKTQVVHGVLNSLTSNKEQPNALEGEGKVWRSAKANFNFYTDSATLQTIVESNITKRIGTVHGPSGGDKLVLFLDDLNLPYVDPYSTQSSIALLRQMIDYGHWYDRGKFTMKQVQDVQFLTCMNPSAGSFTINPRLQRHFTTFALPQLSTSSLQHIFATFLDGYVADFVEDIRKLSSPIIKATLGLHTQICSTFRKTAANFHYEFNIRHLANLFQGLLMSKPSTFDESTKFVLLWAHEAMRVYGDRLVTTSEVSKLSTMVQQTARKTFSTLNFSRYFSPPNASLNATTTTEPIVFCHFAEGLNANEYDQVLSYMTMLDIAEDALTEYNDMFPKMELVLFQDALDHIARIVRIISCPAGHALLVGVGGSGRKSLARLAAFIVGFSVVEIIITPMYSQVDFKTDLQNMLQKAGVKGEKIVFLFSDGQIKNERMLVQMNDLLSNGQIPDLFSADEQTNIAQQMQPKVQAALSAATITSAALNNSDLSEKDRCWQFFVEEVQANLHVVLCFSPATSAFRSRAKKFPALVNCTTIDWFRPWPSDALHSVAVQALEEVGRTNNLFLENDLLLDCCHQFLPYAYQSTNEAAEFFYSQEKRRIYSTPKSYLQCLELFKTLLLRNHTRQIQAVHRLKTGLEKMEETKSVVENMKVELDRALAEAEAKKVVVEQLAKRLEEDKIIVERETQRANEEKESCAIIQAEVAAKKEDTEADLAQAEPMVEAAMAALDTLNKKDLGSCKTMTKPPAGVGDIFGAVMVLLAGTNPNIVIQKSGKVKDKDRSWETSKKALLGNINGFVDELKGFKNLIDDHQVPDINWKEVRPFLLLEHFNVEAIEKKNSAAAGLCAWVINIVAYYDAIVVVEPKKKALAEATEKLRSANEKLVAVNSRVEQLEERLKALTDEYEQTNREVEETIATVERGRLRIELATRLTNALSSEKERWAVQLQDLHQQSQTLVCDVMVASSFTSYVAGFTKPFRERLLMQRWLPYIKAHFAANDENDESLPMSLDCDPLKVLTTEAEIAEWNTMGLPSDRVSAENAAILKSSNRWPLLIDSQLQGIHWLREMEKAAHRSDPSSLHVVRQDYAKLPQLVETAVENGHTLIIENMTETIEICLWPIISKNITKRGNTTLLKLGDKMVEMQPEFRFYMHTKLSNPHFQPEVQAETAMINFTVTQKGLEDQLLSLVIRKEWPKKAKARTALIQQQNEFKVHLQQLEDRILQSLSEAEGDLTENIQVITDLETTKATAVEISIKAEKAKKNEAQINELSAQYQSVASRGALLFSVMSSLSRMHTFYVYSLNAFVVIFQRGIDVVSEGAKDAAAPTNLLSKLKAAARKVIATQRFQWNSDLLLADRVVDENQNTDTLSEEAWTEELPSAEEIAARCEQLEASVTDVVFNYIRRGFFEMDKLSLASLLCFSILQSEGKMAQEDIHQLVSNASANDAGEGMGVLTEWMSEATFLQLRRLEGSRPSFKKLTTFMKSDSEDWNKWFGCAKPEHTRPPRPYNNSATDVEILQLLRVLRPDRMVFALQNFVTTHLGAKFIYQPPFDMEATYQETSASTPMFFVLFPGVDPTVWIETLGNRFNYTFERGNLANLSMGQGQEEVANAMLSRFASEGNWIILQNIHLMPSWLSKLERTLETLSTSADPNFRCFLSAEPPALASLETLPESLLQSCIKVANEAPTDLKSNLKRAWAQFSVKTIDACTHPAEYQGLLFALCLYHALILGRRRFGSKGWNRMYSFSTGDLLICSDILRRYMDNATLGPESKLAQPPWEDLRYIFGEIMYGGHITDHMDRVTNHCYLQNVFKLEALEGKTLIAGFAPPEPSGCTYSRYSSFIDSNLSDDSPTMYGLHPNAEIGYLITAANNLFNAIALLQPNMDGNNQGLSAEEVSNEEDGASDHAVVLGVISALLEQLPPEIDLSALKEKAEPLLSTPESPYVIVALQEAVHMHTLMTEIHTSLVELVKGIHGTLNMTDAMEDLLQALSINQVPGRNILHHCSWEKHAWWSTKSLSAWFANLLDRATFIKGWIVEFKLPYSTWLSGLSNPAAFLTAIKLANARKYGMALDGITLETHVTTMEQAESTELYPEMGSFVHGLYLDGARWKLPMEADSARGSTEENVDGVVCGGNLAAPRPKELLPLLPVLYVRAVPVDEKWEETNVGYFRRQKDIYDCPVYQTTQRGPTFVVLATMKTLDPKSKWVLSGTAIIMQTDT